MTRPLFRLGVPMYPLRTILLLVLLALGSAPATTAAARTAPPTASLTTATAVRLYPNYPNPFAGTTTLRYALPDEMNARLAVYDVLGRTVRVLGDSRRPAGEYTAVWDGRDEAGQPVAPGLYLYRLEAGGARHVRKMLLVR